jgi:hypothetical protein
MPRPKSPNPNIKIHVTLRPETIARLRIYFASEDDATGLIRGAVSRFVDAAITEKFERIASEQANSQDPDVQRSA